MARRRMGWIRIVEHLLFDKRDASAMVRVDLRRPVRRHLSGYRIVDLSLLVNGRSRYAYAGHIASLITHRNFVVGEQLLDTIGLNCSLIAPDIPTLRPMMQTRIFQR